SNSVSLFGVRPNGLELEATVSSGGVRPISVTVRGKLAYVLNAGGSGNISGFALSHDGLTPLAGSTQPLGAGSSGPAQVSFTPDGAALVVTEKTSRSEEHTSELQSRGHLVCRLLLEKKKHSTN